MAAVCYSFLDCFEKERSFSWIIRHNPALSQLYELEETVASRKLITILTSISDQTGLKSLPVWYGAVALWDWFVLNGDRHWGNISLILSKEGWRVAPLFDNGAALDNALAVYPEYTYQLYKPSPYGLEQLAVLSTLLRGVTVVFNYSSFINSNPYADLMALYGEQAVRLVAQVVSNAVDLFPVLDLGEAWKVV